MKDNKKFFFPKCDSFCVKAVQTHLQLSEYHIILFGLFIRNCVFSWRIRLSTLQLHRVCWDMDSYGTIRYSAPWTCINNYRLPTINFNPSLSLAVSFFPSLFLSCIPTLSISRIRFLADRYQTSYNQIWSFRTTRLLEFWLSLYWHNCMTAICDNKLIIIDEIIRYMWVHSSSVRDAINKLGKCWQW